MKFTKRYTVYLNPLRSKTALSVHEQRMLFITFLLYGEAFLGPQWAQKRQQWHSPGSVLGPEGAGREAGGQPGSQAGPAPSSSAGLGLCWARQESMGKGIPPHMSIVGLHLSSSVNKMPNFLSAEKLILKGQFLALQNR